MRGLLQSEDVFATAKAMQALGAKISRQDDQWVVEGCGPAGLQQPDAPLDFGNAGTGVRLMMGVIAGFDIRCQLTGDASLSRRPMGRVLRPLQEMGLVVTPKDADKLPFVIQGRRDLQPITYELPVASAQVKSAILLAGLHARGTTTVIEPQPTRDHTERMIGHFGGTVRQVQGSSGTEITVTGPVALRARDLVVPGDPSSAAFLVAAALIVPGSDLTIEGVLNNPARIGFYQTVQEMGADLTLENPRVEAGEPVVDVRVRYQEAPLRGVEVPAQRVPSMVDEYPVLAALAAYAQGETSMHGLGELRVKESDRLTAMANGLLANGVAVRVEGDSLLVQGGNGVPGGAVVATELDHRIAMAFLVLGLGSQAPVIVDDVSMIDTSFPTFITLLSGLGAQLEAAA